MFGCIADDFTGATDMGALLARRGMRVSIFVGVPDSGQVAGDTDAMIVALKSRTIEPDLAVSQSLAAAKWLKNAGAGTLYFKYCSTFDSTDRGNIGPVAIALADFWDAGHVMFNPAFPENGRTVRNGHLYVDGKPISETGMANHPLTPMRDANLVSVLSRQICGQDVGLIGHELIEKGSAAVSLSIAEGPRFQIADSVSDDDLRVVAAGAKHCSFATGGSAFGAAYAGARSAEGRSSTARFPVPPDQFKTVILAGSCSEATLRQIAAVRDDLPHLRLDAETLAEDECLSVRLIAEAQSALEDSDAVLLSSSVDAKALAAVQENLGGSAAGVMIEAALADIAFALFEAGHRIFIVAGGETSGAVAERLCANHLLIGPEIAPGVPWCYSAAGGGLWLALKSGNFGGDDFFETARARLKESTP
jgi:uncharacterized protein YgbK (DUF1537 family)